MRTIAERWGNEELTLDYMLDYDSYWRRSPLADNFISSWELNPLVIDATKKTVRRKEDERARKLIQSMREDEIIETIDRFYYPAQPIELKVIPRYSWKDFWIGLVKWLMDFRETKKLYVEGVDENGNKKSEEIILR
jgi:hypothetical protein